MAPHFDISLQSIDSSLPFHAFTPTKAVAGETGAIPTGVIKTVRTSKSLWICRRYSQTNREKPSSLYDPFALEKNLLFPLLKMVFNLRSSNFSESESVDWTTRLRIALGAARGLAHLHNQGNIKIMHRDICTSNILLNVDFEAVIGRFSLAVIVHGHVHVPIRGTRGFVAPEFFQTIKCTLKVDVFSYGRMLLELISGKEIAELYRLEYDVLEYDEGLNFDEWIGDAMNELGRVIDPNLQGDYVIEEAARLLRLALLCSLDDPSFQPEMSEVVRMLESHFLQQDPGTKSSWSQSECDSTPYYSFPPSPSPLGIAP